MQSHIMSAEEAEAAAAAAQAEAEDEVQVLPADRLEQAITTPTLSGPLSPASCARRLAFTHHRHRPKVRYTTRHTRVETLGHIFPRPTSPIMGCAGSAAVTDASEKEQYRMSNFRIYDGYNKMTVLDAQCLEGGAPLYVLGSRRDVTQQHPADGATGIDVCKGPLTDWWIAGFDYGPDFLFGVSTADADYYLDMPDPKYASIVGPLLREARLLKNVVEFVTAYYDSPLEALLEAIQVSYLPSSMLIFSLC